MRGMEFGGDDVKSYGIAASQSYNSPEGAIMTFQILEGEAQVVQIMLKPQEKFIAKHAFMYFMFGSIEMENTYVPENEGSSSDGFVGNVAPFAMKLGSSMNGTKVGRFRSNRGNEGFVIETCALNSERWKWKFEGFGRKMGVKLKRRWVKIEVQTSHDEG
ncbi:hypothetical protein Lal_00027265 [Lupinus albus]|nr:hypothetical protein Lal_00027265 [Lupinus albus]